MSLGALFYMIKWNHIMASHKPPSNNAFQATSIKVPYMTILLNTMVIAPINNSYKTTHPFYLEQMIDIIYLLKKHSLFHRNSHQLIGNLKHLHILRNYSGILNLPIYLTAKLLLKCSKQRQFQHTST